MKCIHRGIIDPGNEATDLQLYMYMHGTLGGVSFPAPHSQDPMLDPSWFHSGEVVSAYHIEVFLETSGL